MPRGLHRVRCCSCFRLSPAGFLAFLIARIVVVFAVQIQAVVVAWQVHDLTRDPLSLAYVGLAQFIPMLVLLMPAGDLIDRYDRKLILMLSFAGRRGCAAALLWLSLSEGRRSVGTYAVLVLYGCGSCLHRAGVVQPPAADRAARAPGCGHRRQQHDHARCDHFRTGDRRWSVCHRRWWSDLLGVPGLLPPAACCCCGCRCAMPRKRRHWKPLPGRASPRASTLSRTRPIILGTSRWTCSPCCSAA